MTVRNKRTVTTTLAVAIAAAFAGLMGASPAEAACALFWGVGNSAQCKSEIGRFAIATHDGYAEAVGIGGAISVGSSYAETNGVFAGGAGLREEHPRRGVRRRVTGAGCGQ